ncbi:tetratricopeptide repeat (TPR)-like superfamily protein [Artemisia annua]|uniref:Tetratricopeptide repeat (TPR)-like superfamily protein n=1 Tax=Artemisia annua TaxID=35608 RepID=A0A2U1MTP8_ARTAN|nr:tetratricopeptide repeat (TPR)-like superfamily protein [Artemisia annua]
MGSLRKLIGSNRWIIPLYYSKTNNPSTRSLIRSFSTKDANAPQFQNDRRERFFVYPQFMLNKCYDRQLERRNQTDSSNTKVILPTRLKENAEQLCLYIEMPGVLEEGVKVSVEHKSIVVKGQVDEKLEATKGFRKYICWFDSEFIDLYKFSDIKVEMTRNSGELKLTIPKLKQEEDMVSKVVSEFIERDNVGPNRLSYAFALKAVSALEEWKEIHSGVLKLGLISDEFVFVCLVEMYTKVGLVESARQMFDEMSGEGGMGEKGVELFEGMGVRYGSTWSCLINGLMGAGEVARAVEVWRRVEEKDVVTWTTMIHGFSQNGEYEKGLAMFFEMLEEGVKPNDQTIVCVLLACAKAGALETGVRVHDYVVSNGFGLKKGITAALVDMYAKCGSIENASRVFDMAEEKDLRTWSVMIWSCAINGYLDKAIQYFNKMKSSGIEPDGLAGRLNAALRFINNMSIEPDFVIWGALFSACRAHKNIQMAEYASGKLLELEPKHPGGYVFLSNVYAGVGRWQDVEKINKGVDKDPGWSYIEMKGQVTSFVAGDRMHDRLDEIHLKLNEITKSAREHGYMPETDWVLHNIEEEENEDALGSQ